VAESGGTALTRPVNCFGPRHNRHPGEGQLSQLATGQKAVERIRVLPRDKPIADVMAPPGKSIIGKSKGRSDIRPLGRVMLMTMKSLDLIESQSLARRFLGRRGVTCNS